MRVALAVGVVAVALLAWSVFGRGLQPTTPTDTVSTEPTDSAWDEKAPDSPSLSSIAPNPNAGQQVPCLQVDIRTVPLANAFRLTAAGLSVPVPSDGTGAMTIPRLLTDTTIHTYQYPDSTWASFLPIGRIPTSEGFTDPTTTARRVTECHLTGSKLGGHEPHEVLVSEAVTVDDRRGHRVRIHSVSSRAPGGGVVLSAVALDVGDPAGLSVHWGGAVGADTDARPVLDQAKENLRIAWKSSQVKATWKGSSTRYSLVRSRMAKTTRLKVPAKGPVNRS